MPKIIIVGNSNKRKYFNQIFENLHIDAVAAEGKALTRHNDLVIFVKYGAPGDLVDVQIKKTRRRHMEGEIIKFHSKSELRAEPFCDHFGICGGCKWQHLKYEEQLANKQKQVSDSLQRIGKVNYPYQTLKIKGSEKTRFYRNKLEFTFSDKRWFMPEEIKSGEIISDSEALGFHVPGYFDKVLDINKCWLQDDLSNDIRLKVKEFALENDMPFYNFKEKNGLLRNIIIRNNSVGDWMVILILRNGMEEKRELLLSYIRDSFPQIKSLHYMINDKKNDSSSDLDSFLFHGEQHITEEMEGLKFRIGPKSFYQTNSAQAYELYKITREFANLTTNELVYDLYTGTGTIAAFVGKKAKKVVGIEYVEEAVADARKNAQINQQENLEFHAGDMATVLTKEFMQKHGTPDVIITDPPRAGMHPDVTKRLAESGAKRIVYVSCNPATQARDIELLASHYKISKACAVDMFPHTQHVESVVLLEINQA